MQTIVFGYTTRTYSYYEYVRQLQLGNRVGTITPQDPAKLEVVDEGIFFPEDS